MLFQKKEHSTCKEEQKQKQWKEELEDEQEKQRQQENVKINHTVNVWMTKHMNQ